MNEFQISSEFENKDQARAYSSYRPDPPLQLIGLILDFLRQRHSPPYSEAIDVACGTGQSSVVLAPYFDRVTAFDISEAQIREAEIKRFKPNISYMVAHADRLPAENNSVDLVTAGTCLHWLDSTKFFQEVQRVLVDDGVLAVYSSKNIYPIYGRKDIDRKLRKLTDKVLYKDLQPYRSKQVNLIMDKYKSIDFPFRDIQRIDDVKQKFLANVNAAAGYIRSMSTFQNMRNFDLEQAEDLLAIYTENIMKIIGAPTSNPETTPLFYLKEYFVILCRK